jgi:hypothetical protein
MKRLPPALLVPLLLSGLLALVAAVPASAQEPLTLRINDTSGVADGLVAVVLRTYASRPVHQGQICFRAQFFEEGGGSPFASFEQAVVFSADGDATTTSTFDPTTGDARVEFISDSNTINAVDGPLAVFFFQLDAGLTPGEQFVLAIDTANTALLDENDNPIPITPRSGELTVISPSAPRSFEAEGDDAAPGALATLGASTESIFPILLGRVGIRFDPSVVTQVVDAVIDPRYGNADWQLSVPSPGLAMISFESPDTSLNGLPGTFLGLRVRTSSSALPGTQSLVSLDAESTFLIDVDGNPISIALDTDVLEIMSADVVFRDGFESGALGGWSAVTP